MSETSVGIDTGTLRRRLQQDEQQNAHKRRFIRYATFVVSRLVMMNNSQSIDGVVNEISQGGMRFRPASRFIQRRDGETVSIVIEELAFSGRIRASRPDGYGIELLDTLPLEMLERFLAA